MKIKKQVIEDIFQSFDEKKERGGILGGIDDLIYEYAFDQMASSNENEYIPNVDFLNSTICTWSNLNIDFLGFVHSHYMYENLSYSDIEYARKIISKNSCSKIYMLIVLMKEMRLIGYVVSMISVVQCEIEVMI
ncbi:MAG: hypothetical protein NC347_00010 [Clostridium sp.]|nr:hypothetical protein [Clostridium sp.]